MAFLGYYIIMDWVAMAVTVLGNLGCVWFRYHLDWIGLDWIVLDCIGRVGRMDGWILGYTQGI